MALSQHWLHFQGFHLFNQAHMAVGVGAGGSLCGLALKEAPEQRQTCSVATGGPVHVCPL